MNNRKWENIHLRSRNDLEKRKNIKNHLKKMSKTNKIFI